ncbi:MAG: hypothetical protein ABFR32_12275 [Bacteroidota bacterium]
MKTLIKTKKAIIITIVLLAIFSFTMIQLNQEKELIIGTWINSETPEWKWVFKTDGKCYDYLRDKLSDTYIYSIETRSPQCGQNIPTGELFSYLKLTNVNNNQDQYCYEILSLNDEWLQIRWLERGGFILFKKQLNKYDLNEKSIRINFFDVSEEFSEEDILFEIGEPDSISRSDYDQYYYGNSVISVRDLFITNINILDTSLSINNIKIGDDILKVKSEFLKNNVKNNEIVIYHGDNSLTFYYDSNNKITKIIYTVPL